MKNWSLSKLLQPLLLCVVLHIAAATAQPKSPEDARQLLAQATQLYEQGKWREALPLAQRAWELRERLAGEDPDTALAARTLANIQRNLDAYAQAELLYQRALAIQERRLGPEHPETAITLNNLAILYTFTSAYWIADPFFHRDIRIRERQLGPEHEATARWVANLAALYQTIGEDAKAEALYLRALRSQERVLGTENAATARTIVNLANVYHAAGDHARAEALYLRALPVLRKVHGEEHYETASTLNNLGMVYTATGAYSRAEAMLRHALDLSIEVLGPDAAFTGEVLSNLGQLYEAIDAIAQAKPMFERALEIRQKVLGPKHPNTAAALWNLGRLVEREGSVRQAEALLRRALAIDESVLGPERGETAEVLQSLARLYGRSGAYARAESLQRRSLAILEKLLGADHFVVGDSLESLAVLLWAQGRAQRALPLLQRAARIRSHHEDRFLLAGSEIRKQQFLRARTASGSAESTLALALDTQESLGLGLMRVLQVKGRALDAASASLERLRDSLRPADRALLTELSGIANQLSALTYRAEAMSAQAYRQRTRALMLRQEELETQLAAQSAEFRRQAVSLTLPRIRAAIPGDAALLEWLRYEPLDPKATSIKAQWREPRYMVYVVRSTGKLVAVDVGAAKHIDALVLELRKAASNPGRQDVRQAASALYARLIEPLRPHLGGVRQLLMSPDSALNLVPMAALLDARGHYLLEQWEVTHLTSGRDLLRLAANDSAAGNGSVIMANPNFGPRSSALQLTAGTKDMQQRSAELDRGGLVFRALPGTAEEARAILALLHNQRVRLLTGEQASEANLKQLRAPRILHLATHGFFLRDQDAAVRAPQAAAAIERSFIAENPLLRSGLALAGANTRHSGAEDGILTALEASRLDLRGTQLVVLSACETALGEVLNGEGITGLRRGLLLAGARTQVSSLWRVADLSTKDLMVRFYRHLAAGEGRSAALRAAQLELLAIARQAHPYHWAGFVSTGDWTPLASNLQHEGTSRSLVR